MTTAVSDINIAGQVLLPTPLEIKQRIPLTASAEKTVVSARAEIINILEHRDPRVLLIAGPCSIHDCAAALEYAQNLRRLARETSDVFFLVMRVYFEKPRTALGWKGLINDPHLDDSFRIDEGLCLARKLLLDLAELGVPAATEALDPLIPQYLAELVSWYAIGARTTESQTHREMASGLSAPVGFKNSVDGRFDVAIAAIRSAASPHHFLGVTEDGRSAVFQTRGNRYGHLVLRGGAAPNYGEASVMEAEGILLQSNLRTDIVIDCSHGNSLKDPARQPFVFNDCIDQIARGRRSIVGMMLESNLFWGNQSIPADLSKLRHGVSVTDACIDWETTEKLIKEAAEKLRPIMEIRKAA